MEFRFLATESGYLVAIHHRQTDVQEDDVGLVEASHFEGLFSVMRGEHFLSQGDQQ